MKGAKTSSGMSPNEISFFSKSMFRCATFLFAVAKVYLFLHSANFSLFFFEEQSKILGSTGKSVYAGEFDNNRINGFTLDFFFNTD